MGGGVNSAKLKFVEEQYGCKFNGQGDHLFCIITDRENVRTVAAREFTTKKSKKYQVLYKCNKPVKQYYIYFHDSVLGGPCYYEGEADPFDQPVLDNKNRKVTPPDLRKERQLALCEELLKPKYTVNGFKTAELQRTLSGLFGNSAQIHYEMKKLMARGAIKKQKSKSFYRVTENG